MLISLSKKVSGQPRHVVLVCEPGEVANAGYVIGSFTSRHSNYKRRYVRSTNNYRYTFDMSYLDDMLLAFPVANKSPGLQRRMDRLSNELLAMRQVDPFPIPGLWDRKLDRKAIPFAFQYPAISECVRFLLGEMDAELAALDETSGRQLVESFLENDEMGLGKTFIMQSALALISEQRAAEFRKRKRGLKVLVVAPKNGKFVWQRENWRWFDFDLTLVDADQHDPAQRAKLIKQRSTITVINPEMLRGQQRYDRDSHEIQFKPTYPDLFNYHYDYVILDEYQRFGSPTSQQTIGMLKLRASRFLPASGTPYLNRPPQMWPVLHRCWPQVYNDYENFVKAIQILDHSGRVIGYNPKYAGQMKKFVGARSIRRRKDMVLTDLPPLLPIDAMIELNREQRRIYNKIRDELILMMEDGTASLVKQRTQIIRLKQACFSPELFGGSKHSAKLDELREIVATYVDSGEKLLIGTEWVKAARILEREFAHFKPAFVDGSVTGLRRMAEADRFNTDPNCHLYIGTIGANREAVTLSAATTVILTDKDWSPMVNSQFVARSASGGLRGLDAHVDQVSVVSMIAANTCEERVEAMLAFKQGGFDAFVEPDGGLRLERQIVRSLRDLI
jgi:SNF2 family DNA or RNA helicase